MQVVIRVDASVEIGTGHMCRCLALASALADMGASVHFICRVGGKNSKVFLSERKFPVSWIQARRPIDQKIDAYSTSDIIKELGIRPDWLIVDHYDLDVTWESILRPAVRKIMVIDDLADRRHDCDFLLDQNYHGCRAQSRYHNLVPDHTIFMLGPRYALLDATFRRLRLDLESRPKESAVGNFQVLLFFGGTDPVNETSRVLKSLDPLADKLLINVVTGKGNPKRKEVAQLCKNRPWCRYFCQISDMASMIAASNLMVGAGGSTTWERFCLKTPGIVVSIADNQVSLAEPLARDGYILYLGRASEISSDDYLHAVALMLRSEWLRRYQAQKAARLVDGLGAIRVARMLTDGEISLRQAVESDSSKILEWRNALENRKFSFSNTAIPAHEHERWFKKCIADDDRILLVAEKGRYAIGVLRFDINGDEAVISVYMVPGFHGQGLGVSIIKAGTTWLSINAPQVNTIRAEVLPHNNAARRAFSAAGFTEKCSVFIYSIRKT
ncbi:MAG: UDP-2,4-diacetamido-2,4,6-trideoxy-beta-L-altropyranose hydrolase [Desulfobacteraceae bacterium 4484_190.2]|nr:MAG: UDP-2,4-diacetamido-2,4,6-trideoxy-beta-L-altropyranose hydrolase [Desulfobacteraceae bacterium 4484_190.2]